MICNNGMASLSCINSGPLLTQLLLDENTVEFAENKKNLA